MYAHGFRIYFTPLPGFFSPFPHGTGSLSVNDEYLALEDGPPMFRQDFTCPALLVSSLVPHRGFRVRGYHPLWPAFPDRSINTFLSLVLTNRSIAVHNGPVDYCGPATPGSPFESPGLGSSAFARHYWRNHCCFLFLPVLRWFTSRGLLLSPYRFRGG